MGLKSRWEVFGKGSEIKQGTIYGQDKSYSPDEVSGCDQWVMGCQIHAKFELDKYKLRWDISF